MSENFRIDLKPLQNLLVRTSPAAAAGAKAALRDIKDDWVKEARNIAPLDTSNLRKQIEGRVEDDMLGMRTIITANAKQNSGGKDFNYGYYIHEGHMAEDGKSLKRSGTTEKFLDESADEEKWLRMIEEEIADKLRKAGW